MNRPQVRAVMPRGGMSSTRPSLGAYRRLCFQGLRISTSGSQARSRSLHGMRHFCRATACNSLRCYTCRAGATPSCRGDYYVGMRGQRALEVHHLVGHALAGTAILWSRSTDASARRCSLEVHHLVGDALADEAAHHAGQAVLEELDAQAAHAGAHPVAQPRLVGLERRARHALQHPLERCTVDTCDVAMCRPVQALVSGVALTGADMAVTSTCSKHGMSKQESVHRKVRHKNAL